MGKRRKAAMWSWIVTALLYLLGMGMFAFLGGIGAAGEALRQWGASTARRRRASSAGS